MARTKLGEAYDPIEHRACTTCGRFFRVTVCPSPQRCPDHDTYSTPADEQLG
jgi:hypothetical protein